MIPGITAGQRTAPATEFLFPSLFADTDTFYSPTVSPGAVTLAPSLFSDTDTFYAPVVAEPYMMLTEDGDQLLLEDGSLLVLEG